MAARSKGMLEQAGSDIFKRIDRLSSIMKLAIVGVSGYLVYRKFKQEVITPPPAPAIQPIAYQQVVPDQQPVIKALSTLFGSQIPGNI
jgi:hypothetical protein